jgi:TetR/AcrR family transcriptional regulator, repressor for neighboring sulfatase
LVSTFINVTVILIYSDVNNRAINMNVNSRDKRVRRTAEEAKSLILSVASDRLSAFGLEGLNISGVAKDAGMSHATVIHHFGSTGAMREALLEKMTHDLLSDVMVALNHHEEPAKILDHLFEMLSQGGHGRLLAWLALDQQAFTPASGSKGLFTEILNTISEDTSDPAHAKQIIFLVAIAAMGKSICGDAIAGLIGMNESEAQQFPEWLAELIRRI